MDRPDVRSQAGPMVQDDGSPRSGEVVPSKDELDPHLVPVAIYRQFIVRTKGTAVQALPRCPFPYITISNGLLEARRRSHTLLSVTAGAPGCAPGHTAVADYEIVYLVS